MIRADNLGVTYPDGTQALNGVNLRVAPGEFVFLVGHSGAGKTTLLKLLLGILRPTEGSLTVAGLDMKHPAGPNLRNLRRKVGAVFQDFRLIKGRTALENVALGLWVLDLPGAVIRERSAAALQAVGLAAKSQVRVETLSWGEQQRVALARALARQPSLILADEPTGNLDQGAAALVMELLLALQQKGTTVLVATHALALVRDLGRRVITLEEGRLVQDTAASVGSRGLI